MATGGYDVGKAFVQAVMSFDKAQKDISRFVSGIRPIEIPVHLDPKKFGQEVEQAAAKAAKGTSVDLGSPKLDTSKVGKQLADAGKGAKVNVPVDADTALLDAKLREVTANRLAILAKIDLDVAGLREKLAQLQTQSPTISVDLDLQKTAAEAEIAALEAKRIRIQLQVDADTAKAQAELAAVGGAANRLDGKTANINVESSSASRAIGIMSLLTAGIAAAGFAAPAAAAAIAAIPAAIGVAGQGIGALVAGFNGIGTAVKAMQTADDESTAKATSNAKKRSSAANQVASAESALASAQTQADHASVSGAEQVQSARESLARAQDGLAQAQESALRRVQDAERSYTYAQQNSRDAQDALNLARKEAKDRLEDLRIALKGSALDEESATIALEKAQAKLAKLQSAGVTGLDLREADLGARQAAQSLLEVQNRYSDLQEQADYAAKTGVEGDKSVIAANKAVRDSSQRVQDAELNLTQARSDGARQVTQAQTQLAQASEAVSKAQEHAAWAQADAVKSVADAQRNLAAATAAAGVDGTVAMDKLNLAMSKLTPEGRSFATFLQREAKPALIGIGDAVQRAMLPNMETAFRNLLQLTPLVSQALTETGQVIGELALKGSQMVTSGPWKRDFATIASNNNDILRALGEAGLSVADAFRNILVTSGPMLKDFANLASKASETFANFIQGKRDSGELPLFFHDMTERLKELWDIVSTVGKAVWDLAAALAPFGGGLLHIIEALAKLITAFTTANPELTQLIAVLGLGASAFILFGRAVTGVFGAFASGKKGIQLLTGNFTSARDSADKLASGTNRLAGAAGAVAHPIYSAQLAASSLATAYKEGADSARTFFAAHQGTGNAVATLDKAFNSAGGAALRFADAVVTGTGPAIRAIPSAIDNAVTATASAMGRFGDSVRSGVQSAVTSTGATLSRIGDTLRNGVMKPLLDAQTAYRDTSTSVRQFGAAHDALNVPLGQSQTLIARVRESFNGFAVVAAGAGAGVTAGLATPLKAVAEGASTVTTALSSGLTTTLGTVRSGLEGVGVVAAGTAKALTTGLTKAATGLVGALGGPWGLAIAAAVIGLSLLSQKSEDAAKTTAAHKSAVDSLADAYKQSGGALDENIINTNNKSLADKNVAANARAAGSSFETYAAAANGNAQALKLVTSASDDAITSIAKQAGLTDDQVAGLVAVNHELINNGGTYTDVAGKVKEFSSTIEAAGTDSATSVSKFTTAQQNMINAILNGTGAVGEEIKKNKEARDLYLLLTSNIEGTTEATVQLWEAQNKQSKSAEDAANANLSYRDALAALKKAQQDSADALKAANGDRTSQAYQDALRQEEHQLLAVAEAKRKDAEASSTAKTDLGRLRDGTAAYNKELLNLAGTYKGELPQSLATAISGMDTAQAQAAGFKVGLNSLGEAIVTINGRPIKIKADTTAAGVEISNIARQLSELPPDKPVTVTALTVEAAQRLAELGYTIVHLPDGNIAVYSPGIDPVKTALDNLKVQILDINATTGTVHTEALTQDAESKLNDLGFHVEHLPDGTVKVRLEVDNSSYFERLNPGGPGHIAATKAEGGIVEFFAGGGFSQVAAMSAGVADVVPPNTMRVIGDRTQDDEAYIPINRSPRSVAVLTQTANRMGFALSPMASGGILAMADGGTVPASTSPPPATPSTTPDQLTALASAMSTVTDVVGVLTAALTLLQDTTILFTTTALTPLVEWVNTGVVPALTLTQNSFGVTTGVVATSMAAMTLAVSNAGAQIGTVFSTLQYGLQVTGQAFQSTSDWTRDSWGRIREYAAAPTRDVLNGPFSAGLIAAWNYLDSSFGLNHHLEPIAVPFAEGGPVRGPGTGTSDSILTRLSNGEYVLPAALTKRIFPFLEALRSGQAEALQAAGYASGGVVADTGSGLNAKLLKAQAFAQAQNGKPYIWGGVGPLGFDCSGLMSAVTNVLRDEPNPYQRVGVAASAPWPGFVRGLSSAFAMGSSSVHTAGTLGGINVESTGTHVRFGGDAHGADDPQFPIQSSLPVVGGKFVSGGGATFDPAALVAAAFADTAGMIQDVRNRYPGNIMAQQGTGEAAYSSDKLQKYAVDKIAINSVGGGPAVQAAQAFARSALPRFGWGSEQMTPLIALWNGESGWNYRATNPTSGAYGIPQALPGNKMASAGPDWATNPATQITWGLGYIKGRPDYGSPSAAYAKWQSRSPHWYDDGGWLPPGYSTVANHTGKPEAVLTQDQWNALSTMAGRSSGAVARPITVNARTDASPEHIAHTVDRHLSIGTRV